MELESVAMTILLYRRFHSNLDHNLLNEHHAALEETSN